MLATTSITLLMACLAPAEVSKAQETRLRQPVALAMSVDGARLFVANRRSGSISTIDRESGQVTSEQDVGRGLAAMATLPDDRLLAVDRDSDALLVLKVVGGIVTLETRLGLAPDPAFLLVARDGLSCVVASTGSHQLSVISLSVDEPGRRLPKLVRTIELPFAPLSMTWAGSTANVVVADAFGGKIAVIDPTRDAPISIRSIPAHNIRGLATTPDGQSVVVAHQTVNRLARTTFEDVHWGSLVGNHLRVLKLNALLQADADILQGSRLIDIGRTGQAAGDPGSIVFDRQGRMAVALTGVHEVALIADSRSYRTQRVPVGLNSSAILPSPDGTLVYVADALDDTISVVEVASGARQRTIALGPRPELGPVDRGERLFNDARLSHDGWMSCQSCHTDGQSNGLAVDTIADNSYGAPKRVTTLLGVGATGPWTWLGTTDRLEDQVRKSIETTMRGQTPSRTQVDDLTAYLRSLAPPRPMTPKDEAAVTRGREIFQSRRCAECHSPPDYTSEGVFDVGLPDEVGNRKFNPPTLRGVAARPPYLHDGRAATLPDVFLRHRHPRMSAWSIPEVDDLVAFLKSL